MHHTFRKFQFGLAMLLALAICLHVQTARAAGQDYTAWSDLGIIYTAPSGSAYYPSVLYDANGFGSGSPLYKMWYSDGNGQVYVITSTNGVNWGSPTTLSGLGNDAHHAQVLYDVHCFGIIPCNRPAIKYKIWYWDTDTSIYNITAISTAQSADGVIWTNDTSLAQSGSPQLITGGDSGWNRGSYGPISLFYKTGALNAGTDPWNYSYAMYYDGTDGSSEVTGLAYSVDGLNWTAYSNAPVVDKSAGNVWDCDDSAYGTVYHDAAGYHYWYSGGGGDNGSGGCITGAPIQQGIGYASSADGKSWTKAAQPIFHINQGVSYRNQRVYAASVVDDGSGVLKMYYSAVGGAAGNAKKIGMATTAAGTTFVDDDWIGYTSGTQVMVGGTAHFIGMDAFDTIQKGINGVLPGGTVNVGAGIYNEQVIVNKGITINGAGETTIIRPSQTTANAFALYSRLNGGDANSAGILVTNTTDSVTVHNLKIDGSLVTSTPSGARFMGILYRGTPGLIDAVTVNGIAVAEGNGIYLSGFGSPVTVTLSGSTISNYNKNGITANNPGLTANISGTTINGSGPTSSIAQNGIQLGFSATGTISHNTINGNVWTGTYGGTNDPGSDLEADGASGILLYLPAAGVEIDTNNLTANQFGIWSVAAPDVNIHNNMITGLAHSGTMYPTAIAIWSADQWTIDMGGAETATTATIADNLISTNEYGVQVRDYIGGGLAPSAMVTGNTFTNNKIQAMATGGSGFDTGITLAGNTADRAVTVNHSGALLPTIWGKIQPAIDGATAGDTVNVSAGTYNENVLINKNSIRLIGAVAMNANDVPDPAIHTIINGAAPALITSPGITISNGITGVSIKNLRVQNFSSNSGIYGVGGNNGLTIDSVHVSSNNTTGAVNGGGIYMNGPVSNILINNVDSELNKARGIVIWNGFKQNITITNNTVKNNNCCGIELQDGTASGVTISGNTVISNSDSGISAIGLTTGSGPNVISNNTVMNNGRFGIEIKMPNGSGLASGDGSIVIENNVVSLPTPGADLRDFAGIAVMRRGYQVGYGYADIPTGVIIRNNTVSDYRQANSGSTSTGFGIVAEGVKIKVEGNTLTNNDVGIQVQSGHLPYSANAAGDGDQANLADNYFGRGNSPVACVSVAASNGYSGNGVNSRTVGTVGSADITDVNTGMYFCNIQAAIDDATTLNGDTISVPAGTYSEELTIDKSLTLLGPNSAINPNTGTRNPEAVILPVNIGTDPNGTCTDMITVTANNVTIQGFTIDGNNPALTSGLLVNGVDVDACEGIVGFEGLGNITIENNIVQNTTYTGIDFYNVTDPTATSGNYIRYNRLYNMGNDYGIGVVIYNNFYADVSYNVFEAVRVGIQTGNYSQANPGTTASISHNQISSWRRGIFHNLDYSNASAFTIDGNTLDVIDSAATARWDAIMLSSLQTAVNAIVTNNIITAADVHQVTVGYQVWNTPTTAKLTISGGSVTGADYGVWVNNYQGYGPSNGDSSSITIDNVDIAGASLAGVYVQDDPLNTNNAAVQANIINSPISSSANAVLISGSDASATGSCNQISGNSAGVNNTTAAVLNFEKNWWGAASGPSGSGSGSGDTVSANVDYTPWNLDTSCTTSTADAAPVITEGGSTSITMSEDGSPISFDLALNATDADPGDTLTWSISTPALHGVASASGTGTPKLIGYAPSTNYNGSDSFEVQVSDGTLSDTITVNVTIEAVNDAPIITGQSPLSTPEDTALAILPSDLSVTDVDNTYPSGFTLTVLAGTNYTFSSNTITPASNFNGTLTVPVKVNDGDLDSNTFDLTVAVEAVNDAPVITGQSPLSTPEDTALTILLPNLNVTDVDNTYPTDFTLTVLVGTNYSFTGNTITPASNFNGSLTVPVKVNDGDLDSNTFDLTVAVEAVNDAPFITGQSPLSTPEDTALPILPTDLTVTDVDNTYPTGFTLTVLAGINYTFSGNTITPASDFNGSLTVPVKVNDSDLDSNIFNLTVTVSPVNDAPVANAQSVTTPEDTAKDITLTGTDIDGDSLVYLVVSTPSHGALSGTAPAMTYTPAANYNGSDSFTFKVNDGIVDSEVATVSITVSAVNDAPVITGQSPLSTLEDTALTILPSDLTVNDVDNTYPTDFSLTVLTGTNYTFSGNTITPASNFYGSLTVPIKVNDGDLDSNTFDLAVTVSAVNDAPVITGQSPLSTPEDTALTILPSDLTVTDVDNTYPTDFTLTVLAGTNYSLSGNTITPASNFNGSLTVPVKVNDGNLDSNTFDLTVTVSPVNDAPVANAQSVSTPEDTAKAITLTGSDVDGNALTYSVVSGPSHGSLSGTVPALTYTPAANYNGSDSFTFKANDGTVDSTAATVSITVTAVNDAPVANAQSVSTSEDTAKAITLTGSDVDGNTLNYSVVSGPSHGTLSGTAPALTYTPAANYNGSDAFTFKTNDSIVDSAVATVSITVTAVNDAPVANAQSVSTPEDTAKAITLTGSDVDGNTLTYSVVSGPSHGSLSGTVPALTYTPATNYNGSDSFTFKANDGTIDSLAATVSITVTAVNDAPVANAQSVSTPEDTAKAITLTGTDVDGNTLTYSVLSGPSHGTLSGTAPALTYTPAANYNGSDSFTFKANDGTVDSAAATVSITVTAVNDAPVANAQSVSTPEDTAKAITLTGSDVDGNALTYSVVSGPSHGSLSGTVPALTYTPAANYNGSDSFTFKANDGIVDSTAATVSITVTAVNDAPVANAQSVSTPEDTAKAITLTGADVDGNLLTYSVVSGPSHGTLSGTAPALTYTPAANYNGPDSFTFKANDGTVDSAPATISITVTAVNDAPIANGQVVTTEKNTSRDITLTGSDVENDLLTFSVVTEPLNGTLSGAAPSLTYTPTAGYNGPDSFTFKVNDGKLDSPTATVSITVTAVNNPPVITEGSSINVSMSSNGHPNPFNLTLHATDLDSDPINWSIFTPAGNGEATASGGGTSMVIHYTPDPDYIGTDSFVVQVIDNNGGTSTITVNVNVEPSVYITYLPMIFR